METNALPILLELYKGNTTHGRQHETQRQLVTAGVAALTAALLSAMTALRFHPGTLPLAVFVVVAGIVGKRFSEKFYERFRYHTTMAWSFRVRLHKLCPDARESYSLVQDANKADTTARLRARLGKGH